MEDLTPVLPGLLALDEPLSHLGHERASARIVYRDLCESTEPDGQAWDLDGVIFGSRDFIERHLAGIERSSEIPAVQLRPPRPPLSETLADAHSTGVIADAYGHGYTMPAIAAQLGIHPSTVSRRLARHRAQIKT